MIIDGAYGEGGGQILRTCLALSLVTGRPFEIRNIRAGRPKPGLRKQHLAAVRAAAAVGRARVRGDSLGSAVLEFLPGASFAGDYEFDVGSAGSCTLVLQTILPALVLADRSSRLVLRGGTHNPGAPPFHFLEKVFLPLLHRMGPLVQTELRQWGFYPAGGGCIQVEITPVRRISPLNLTDRGDLRHGRAHAVVAGLPRHIAEREGRTFASSVNRAFDYVVEELPAAMGPGNALMAEVVSGNITELFSAFGRRGAPAERVAGELAEAVNAYLASGAAVGPYLADQLLIPLALAGGGRYRTQPPTRHTRTNIEIVRRFLEIEISLQPGEDQCWEVAVGPSPNPWDKITT
ncbi:MAG: RNA 3'-terminal phosphate cyclase [Desulfobacterales bacterium]|nr:RNA 3'-terminal phosphate cyclase [Desulfobacterales bacterium]